MGTAPPASMSMGFCSRSGSCQPVSATTAPRPEAMIMGLDSGWSSILFHEIRAPETSPRMVR